MKRFQDSSFAIVMAFFENRARRRLIVYWNCSQEMMQAQTFIVSHRRTELPEFVLPLYRYERHERNVYGPGDRCLSSYILYRVSIWQTPSLTDTLLKLALTHKRPHAYAHTRYTYAPCARHASAPLIPAGFTCSTRKP